ncbi:MAG: hypothetical protein A2Y88_14205 [Chloroflexi bacterium RBG_13_48_10]|nr:MAG: hypothetical protein A2Y88_14205 [Chloroflexi bacterium RBG_13_48_10]
MRHLSIIPTLLVLLIPHTVMAMWKSQPRLQMDAASSASIETPIAGQAVQGSVVVKGRTGTEGFQSFEVDFSYKDDPTNTWFLIQEGTAPIQEGVLAVWDTTIITDGEYTLRLLVTLMDGAQVEVLVSDLRLRNYSPIETDTPSPTPFYVTLAPGIPAVPSTAEHTPTPTPTPYPMTPTPLPTNPAVITSSQMVLTLGKGAAFSIGLLALLGAYLGVRSIVHKNR